ncbi:MAG: hypothetical protein IJH13_01785 [Bacilli bacterium]|nr:hypothetical protein [Bacilli bacterium]
MKKVLNIKNIGLLLIIVLIAVLTISTKEAKAAGTLTWSGPSSITIRDTIHNIANPIVATRDYVLQATGGQEASSVTLNYTASDTITNYQLTKSAVLNLSNLTFTKPGDYRYGIVPDDLRVSGNNLSYFTPADANRYYEVTVSVRNVVDANNVPTGNFTASMILIKYDYNETTGEDEQVKINPVSGVLYADYDYIPDESFFGHIELSKTVKGIGADTTKYFPFTINIDNDSSLVQDEQALIDSSGWTYPISGIDATVTYNGNTINNPTTITDGTPTTIYLKHGQTAIIGQVTNGGNTFDVIPRGLCSELIDPYTPGNQNYDFSRSPSVKKLAEVDGATCYGSYFTIEENPGDYTPSFSLAGYPATSGYYVSAEGIVDGSNTVDFYNQKEMSPVTGLIFTILPYLILAGIGVGGTLLVMHLKKEEKKAKA